MWGATILPSLKHPQGASFNPRSHVGSDGIAVDEHQGERFQSTLPCGERRVNRWSCVRRNRFQSTLPCGERLISDEHKNSVSSVSIHAPMWGATARHTLVCSGRGGFNPRSHVGSDAYKRQPHSRTKSFNPRSHVGSDLKCVTI